MKTISVCLLLLLCGCDEPTSRRDSSVGVWDEPTSRRDSSVGVWDESGKQAFEVGRIYIEEVGGHKFAVLAHGRAVAICEVTDASLVKTNAEAK